MALALDDAMIKVPQLPALPQIVTRILESLDNDSLNMDALADLIANDPTVSARMLAAANSALYGNHGITSLRQAVLRLGVARVRQITAATAIIDRYHLPLPFDNLRLWQHSLAVAICAEDIARHVGVHGETAWMAGLLHDLGQLLLFTVDPVGYGDILRDRIGSDRPLIDIERERLGLDHAVVGGELALRWNLPQAIVTAIRWHHAMADEAPENDVADVVHCAAALAHALDLGGTEWNRVPPVCELRAARIGLDWREFSTHFPGIEARYDGAAMMLGL